MKMDILLTIVTIWCFVNFIVALYELYVIYYRSKLCHNSGNLLIQGWTLYTRMDERYCNSNSPVFILEFINAILALPFIYIFIQILYDNVTPQLKNLAFYLSYLQVINLLLYIATLLPVIHITKWYYVLLTLPWFIGPILVMEWSRS